MAMPLVTFPADGEACGVSGHNPTTSDLSAPGVADTSDQNIFWRRYPETHGCHFIHCRHFQIGDDGIIDDLRPAFYLLCHLFTDGISFSTE